jgi:S1-C subfamily serine protease
MGGLLALPRRARLVLAVALLALAGLVVLAAARPDGPAPLTRHDVDAAVQRGIAAQTEAQGRAPADATRAYAAIQPSLVLVTATTAEGEDAGAGVIITAEGLVLTAFHVVDGARSIRVSYTDGTSSPARVGRAQRDQDVATLVPDRPPEVAVPAVLGGAVEVGAPVFAVGHPLGLTDSLTAGVVSALDRSVPVPGNHELQHLIQFDAAVNPGSSGGPLLDRLGHVVGIVTALADPTNERRFSGIGFAVPIATAGRAAGGPAR